VKERIFISSVQKELSEERRSIAGYVNSDPLLSRFFDVSLFEGLPAIDRRADDVYLEEVADAAIYVGIFGNDYGTEDDFGLSPTEHEFNHATELGKERLIFIKGTDDSKRNPKMKALIEKAGSQLIRRRFNDLPSLISSLYASLIEYLEQTGRLRTKPYDASACYEAGIEDISEDKMRWFLGLARRGRQYPLQENIHIVEALKHLNLLDEGRPTFAAILLFGKMPQRFLPTSEVKCMHFHGTTVSKPIPSYQIYHGTLYDLVDQSLDFVMSKINRSVGTRSMGPQAPVEYELPREAVAEAIVNAVAHRDYASNMSVQVMLFADRLEVWNPGELRPPLTLESLVEPHPSLPRNPLIAEPLYLAKYIEKAGSGILDMIEQCAAAGLERPVFRQDVGCFIQTLWRPAPVRVTPPVSVPVTAPVSVPVKKLLRILSEAGELGNIEIRQRMELKHRSHIRKHYIDPAIAEGFIELTIPDKPTSKLQKYRLTEKGQAVIVKILADEGENRG
jgi:predicted HTH transcriptional regulator